jgi:manganese transport protein
MEGFLNLRMAPWMRRFITRMVALAPAVVAIALAGNEGIYRLLVLSQVILSLQLPFAIVPLVQFTADRGKMGPFVNPVWVTLLAWLTAAVVIYLNAKLVIDALTDWLARGALWPWLVVVPLAAGLTLLLVFLFLAPWLTKAKPWISPGRSARLQLASRMHPFQAKRIGAALAHAEGDAHILSAAIGLAKAEKSRLYLIHVVDAPGVMLLGAQSGGLHASADETYLEDLVREVEERDLPVEAVLCFGRPVDEIVKAVDDAGIDLLVMGAHGHGGGVGGLIRGETVAGVHHKISVPLLVVPSPGAEPALHPSPNNNGQG